MLSSQKEKIVYFFGGNSSLAGIPSGSFFEQPLKATIISDVKQNYSQTDKLIKELAKGQMTLLQSS